MYCIRMNILKYLKAFDFLINYKDITVFNYNYALKSPLFLCLSLFPLSLPLSIPFFSS